MDAMVLLAFRMGLLVLLWVFILLALRSLRKDTQAATPGMALSRKERKALKKKKGKKPHADRGVEKGPVARLQVVDGPLAGSYMPLDSLSEVVLGRSSQCSCTLPDDYASARHARLFRRGNEWLVEDLDSRNGTYVGGLRIDQPERVDAGSEIKIGRTTVRLLP